MANRVLMDSNGLKISKPGYNVLTTNAENLLFDSTSKMVQVVDSGSVTISGSNTTNVSHPNLGFQPFVWFWVIGGFVYMERVNNTTVRFRGQTAGSKTVHYLVLNVPAT